MSPLAKLQRVATVTLPESFGLIGHGLEGTYSFHFAGYALR